MAERLAPLSILDLSPVCEGSGPAAALRNTLDLARRAEELGYLRYWVAEHHFAPGVASSSPAVLIAAIAAVTSRIRVGSGAVQLGHQTATGVAEAFGTLCGLYPGRIDLGLGRSGQRRQEAAKELASAAGPGGGPRPDGPPDGPPRTVNGLLIPARYSFAHLITSPRFALHSALLQQPGAQSPDFGDQVNDILAFLRGTYRSSSGLSADAIPAAGADAQVWILGSSAGQSARVAGALGLPFAANYHVSPATVLEAADAYRAAFRPSAVLSRPRVLVSADVVVAPTDAEARELAAGYGLWVRSIRTGPARCGSRRPRRWRPSSGPTPTGRWWKTGCRPSSRARPPRWPSTCGCSRTPPGPTSSWSPRSRTSTRTGSAPSSCWPGSGAAAPPVPLSAGR